MPKVGLFSLPLLLITWTFSQGSCRATPAASVTPPSASVAVSPGAWDTQAYFPLLQGRKFGLVCNHTATIGVTHLVDTLVRAGLKPLRLFAPEHGFRGDVPDGQHIGNKRDTETGLEVISIYGENKKPQPEQLAGLDLMVFDIQDVGARFYTYISTLHYVMEACAEAGIPLLVLDRPNPNGHYVDGPVLDPAFRSFVGMHPVPVVYGMTIGEYAGMINGEGWLAGARRCSLQVVPLRQYDRREPYWLPERPSPNLPNMLSVWLYPSLCFFEGTPVSVGRGTEIPFQVIGHPGLKEGDTWFIPVSRPESTQPPQRNKECRGFDLSGEDPLRVYRRARLDLSWLSRVYQAFPDPDAFFLGSGFFDKLAGSDLLRRQLVQGLSESAMRAQWKPGLEKFLDIRNKYLLYPDGAVVPAKE